MNHAAEIMSKESAYETVRKAREAPAVLEHSPQMPSEVLPMFLRVNGVVGLFYTAIGTVAPILMTAGILSIIGFFASFPLSIRNNRIREELTRSERILDHVIVDIETSTERGVYIKRLVRPGIGWSTAFICACLWTVTMFCVLYPIAIFMS